MRIHSKLRWKTIVSRANKEAGYERFQMCGTAVGADINEYDEHGKFVAWGQTIQQGNTLNELAKTMFLEKYGYI